MSQKKGYVQDMEKLTFTFGKTSSFSTSNYIYKRIREVLMMRILLRKNIFKIFEEKYEVTDFFFNDKSKF